MRVIPAIDLKDGQCVRLQKGDYGTAHKVAENPVETAQRFLDAGADLVHMVDLDAAKDGSHANYGVVEQVIRETGATVELGGGIRSMQDVETVLALGVSRVIIGSAAVRDPEFVAEAVKKYGDKIAFMGEIDNKQVDFEGWTQADCEKAAVHAMETCGMKHFIPCITQGGPGSLYQGTYKGLWDAIDDYNCKHFGFTKEQLEAQRLPMSIMF